MAKAPFALPDVEEIAERINWPVEAWPGNCYSIACALVEHGILTDSVPRYGHYLGRVSPRCKTFYARHQQFGFTQHGWAEHESGVIIDPTRWVFLGGEEGIPSIAIIHPDSRRYREYDIGGNLFRQAVLDAQGVPSWDDSDAREANGEVPHLSGVVLQVAVAHLGTAFEPERGLSLQQWSYLANLSPARLGEDAAPFYRALKSAGTLGAFIPYDNLALVLPEEAR